ncbi:TCEA1 [Symbiodinium pilosum]|uniref:TCEA1 protein n=1 Tax=Symbiodinium pilosum TaxID=2952 RepID=A0A812PST7_SYMPI|nr:TCEA1 [Symbiodinium pilosum]
MTNHRAWAMLEDLVVPGCEGGLMPKFEVDVFHYRCLLSNEVETLKVIPRVMWMPFDQKLQIHVKGKKWKSGNVFQQPLGDDGKAEVDIRVTASDLKHKETYHISAQGSPLEERGRLFTTEGPPPQEPPTTVPVTPLPAAQTNRIESRKRRESNSFRPAYRYSTMSPEPPKPKLAVATCAARSCSSVRLPSII